MKIKNTFVLRNVADSWIVLPLADDTVNFNGMMTLNASGVLLWRALEQGADYEDLVKVLTGEYNVTAQQAREDAEDFVRKLQSVGCIEMQ